MSEALKCVKCGVELMDGAKFCPECGTEQIVHGAIEEPTEINCPGCGALIGANAKFCYICGRQSVPEKKPGSIRKTVLGWVGRSVTLLVAILFMAFAFLPVIGYSDPEISGQEIEVDIGYSAVDSIVYCFDAMYSLDDEDIMDSDLYEEAYDLASGVASPDDLDDGEKATLIKLYTRLLLQSEDTVFTPQYAITAFLSWVYLTIAVAYLVISVVDFILYAVGRENDRLAKAARTMLAAIAPLAVVLVISFSLTFGIGAVGGGASAPIIALIILSLLAVAYFAIEHFFLGDTPVKVNVSGIVKRSLATVACILLLFSALLPMFTYEVKTTFAQSSSASRVSCDYGTDFFSNLAFSESELEQVEDMSPSFIEHGASRYQYYTKKQFQKGDVTVALINANLLTYAFAGYGAYEISWVISLVTLAAIIASLGGAVLLWQNMLAMTGDTSPSRGITIPTKVVAAVMAMLLLALVIVFVAITGYNFGSIESEGTKLGIFISPGVIFAVIFAAFAAAVPMGKKKSLN